MVKIPVLVCIMQSLTSFFSRKSNFSLLTQVDVETIWLIGNKVKVNWTQQVIDYMIESMKHDAYLLYENLVTKFGDVETRYEFGDVEFKEETTKVEISILISMMFEKINGRITETAP